MLLQLLDPIPRHTANKKHRYLPQLILHFLALPINPLQVHLNPVPKHFSDRPLINILLIHNINLIDNKCNHQFLRNQAFEEPFLECP